MIIKGLIFAIIIFLVGIGVILANGMVLKQSNTPINRGTLYVGGGGSGNYSKIQDAIDNASSGDTVFVYNDSSPYYENVVVYKLINLIGEDKETTIIDGGGSGNTIELSSNNSVIK